MLRFRPGASRPPFADLREYARAAVLVCIKDESRGPNRRAHLMTQPRVEILYFDGCPNHDDARALIERIAAELQVVPKIDLVKVPDAEAAVELRFLGSPTVRVDGRDIEPDAYERSDFPFSCRVYRGEKGFSGGPTDAWIRAALRNASG
jgi:hypothetical protein